MIEEQRNTVSVSREVKECDGIVKKCEINDDENQSVTWYQYRTVQYRTVSKKYAQNSKIQGPVQYS